MENEIKTRVDPLDGTIYEWDENKKAWFPQVFIIKYEFILIDYRGFFSTLSSKLWICR